VLLAKVILPMPLPAISMSRFSTLVLTTLLLMTTLEFTGPAAQTLAKLLFTAVNALRSDSPVPSLGEVPVFITCCGVLILFQNVLSYI
jgi:hypothetical protein